MQFLKISVRALALGTLVFGLISCNEEARETITDFTVKQAFSVKSSTGEAIAFNKGDQGSYDWDIVLGKDNEGRQGIALVNKEQNIMIPFGTGELNRLDSEGKVGSAATGQGVQLQFIGTDSSYADTTPKHSTESCTVSIKEQVCDNSSGTYKCYDRTITRPGTREVVTTDSGSTDSMQLKIISAKGNLLAVLEYTVDNRSSRDSNGTCY